MSNDCTFQHHRDGQCPPDTHPAHNWGREGRRQRAGELECLLQWLHFTKTEMWTGQGQSSHRAPSSAAPFHKHLCFVPWICQQQLWWKFRIEHTMNYWAALGHDFTPKQEERDTFLCGMYFLIPLLWSDELHHLPNRDSLSLSDKHDLQLLQMKGEGLLTPEGGFQWLWLKCELWHKINVLIAQPLKRKKSSTSS